MTTPEALNALADRVEREEPSRGLDSDIYCATRLPEAVAGNTIPRYTTSLDAAVTLVLEGRKFVLEELEAFVVAEIRRWHLGTLIERIPTTAKTPAAALTAAALRARAADMQARAEDGAPHPSPSGNEGHDQ